MDTQMKINGDMVRSLREEKSGSQEHLADASGLSVRTIQRVESDGIGSAETRLALAATLGVPASALAPSATRVSKVPAQAYPVPKGAWIGLGVGIVCSIGGVVSGAYAGHVDAEHMWRSIGVICGLVGAFAGLMFALSGWMQGLVRLLPDKPLQRAGND
jgi:DNA-binding XRE family transcriptional regulator